MDPALTNTINNAQSYLDSLEESTLPPSRPSTPPVSAQTSQSSRRHQSSPSSSTTSRASKKPRYGVPSNNVWIKYYRDPCDAELSHTPGPRPPKRLYYYLLCDRPDYVISNAEAHIFKAHGIRSGSTFMKNKGIEGQSSLQASFERQKERSTEISQTILNNTLRNAIDVKGYKEAEIELTTHHKVALNLVEYPAYHRLLNCLNPQAFVISTHSRRGLAVNISNSLKRNQKEIKRHLKHIPGLIHFCIDMWTSSKMHSYLAITAQYIDSSFKKQKILLALHNILYTHGGEAQAPRVWQTICDYSLQRKIGWWTADNHGSNDVCLRRISELLQGQYAIGFNPQLRRLHCSGHSINLAITAFFLANNKGAFKSAIESSIAEATSAEEATQLSVLLQERLTSWSKRSKAANHQDEMECLSKLHYYATQIRSSSHQSDIFRDLSDIELGINNETRWNSWNSIINTALNRQGEVITYDLKNKSIYGTEKELTAYD
jgi:hypothetical protein